MQSQTENGGRLVLLCHVVSRTSGRGSKMDRNQTTMRLYHRVAPTLRKVTGRHRGEKFRVETSTPQRKAYGSFVPQHPTHSKQESWDGKRFVAPFDGPDVAPTHPVSTEKCVSSAMQHPENRAATIAAGGFQPTCTAWCEAVEKVIDFFFGSSVWPRRTGMLRSQGGQMAGLPFMYCPTAFHFRSDAQVFRVLFLRRLWPSLPLPRCVPAGVAVLSTSLATTVQLAQTWYAALRCSQTCRLQRYVLSAACRRSPSRVGSFSLTAIRCCPFFADNLSASTVFDTAASAASVLDWTGPNRASRRDQHKRFKMQRS